MNSQTKILNDGIKEIGQMRADHAKAHDEVIRVTAIVQKHDTAVAALNQLKEQRKALMARQFLGEEVEADIKATDAEISKAEPQVLAAANEMEAARTALAILSEKQRSTMAAMQAKQEELEPLRYGIAKAWLEDGADEYAAAFSTFREAMTAFYSRCEAFNLWCERNLQNRARVGANIQEFIHIPVSEIGEKLPRNGWFIFEPRKCAREQMPAAFEALSKVILEGQ